MSALAHFGLVAYAISFLTVNAPLLFGGSSGDGLGSFLAALIYAIFLVAAGVIWVVGTIMIFLGYFRSEKTPAIGNKLLIAGALSVIGSLELILGGMPRTYAPKIELGDFAVQFSALIPLLGILIIGLVEIYLGLRARGGRG